MTKEEIKIITLGDIFKNIETKEKAFNFLNYIKELQQENQQLKEQKDDVVEYIKNETKEFHFENDKYIEILRMLGEIDNE